MLWLLNKSRLTYLLFILCLLGLLPMGYATTVYGTASAQATARKLDLPIDSPIIGIIPSPNYTIDRTFYLLTANALFRSFDDGSSWAVVERWPDEKNRQPTFTTGAVTPIADGAGGYFLLIATTTGDLWRLNPATLAWKPLETGLSPMGPWLLMTSGNGTWLVDPSGVGLTKLTKDWIIHAEISPTASYLAYITDTDPDAYFSGLTLRILSLNDREEVLSIPLQIPDVSEDASPEVVDAARQATISLSLDSFAWSPDGRRLAFVGGQSGISTDLYLYTVATGLIEQLTNGPSQAYQLHWSPDSRWLFHTGVSSFGTGAGYTPTGVWLANSDDSSVDAAYELPENSGSETLVAWLDEETMLVHSWSLRCGNSNLRTVNITTGTIQALWAGAFQDVVYNAARQRLLLSVPNDNNCNSEAISGLFGWQYTVNTSSELALIDTAVYDRITFDSESASGLLYRRGAGLFVLDAENNVLLLPQSRAQYSGQLFFSNGIWAWVESSGQETGVWVESPEMTARQIFAGPATDLYWSPNGEGLFFVSEFEGFAYRAEAPDYLPAPLAKDVEVADLFWLNIPSPALAPTKIMTGEFSPESALTLLFDTKDSIAENIVVERDQAPYAQLTGAQSNRTTYINAIHPFQEDGIDRYFFLTESIPAARRDDFTCQSCQLTIGGGLFSRTEGGWYLDNYRPAINQLGQAGIAPEGELVQIGPDKWGINFPDSWTGQGYIFVTEKLMAEVDGQLTQIFQTRTLESNGGSFDCIQGNCYEFIAEIEFVRGDHPIYDDILVTATGTQEIDGEIQPINEARTYAFSGKTYRLISTDRLVDSQ